MRRGLVVMVPLLAVGIAASLFTLKSRESDAAFLLRQQHPLRVERREVETVVQKAREPVPVGTGTPATGANCRRGSNSVRGNPWVCAVRYASGHVIHYTLTVAPNGSLSGSDPTGERTLQGCCVAGAGGGLQ